MSARVCVLGERKRERERERERESEREREREREREERERDSSSQNTNIWLLAQHIHMYSTIPIPAITTMTNEVTTQMSCASSGAVQTEISCPKPKDTQYIATAAP